MSAAICTGCGTAQTWEVGELPTPSKCAACPPTRCDDCGHMDSMADPCACWIAVDTLAHADLKALFAGADLSLSTPTTNGDTDE